MVAAEASRLTRILLLTIGGLTIARLAIAAVSGLTYDEAILAVKAQHLHLSYFDHPPLASLMIAAMRSLTGSDAALIMRLPAIALFAGTTWLVFRLGTLLFGMRAGFYGAIALSLSPLFSFYFGAFAVTDAPMLFCIAAATFCLCHALRGPGHLSAWWLGTGLFTGLALLSKSFSAVLAIAGAFGYLATSPHHRHWLSRPAPYLVAAIALALMTPVLLWNAQNQWIGFSFPGGHSLAGGLKIQPLRLLTYWGVQALIVLPWIWLGLVIALIHGLASGPRSQGTWLLSWLAAVPLAVFTLVQLLSTVRRGFHWAAPGYLLLFPLLGLTIERAITASHIRRIVATTVATLAIAAAVVAGHMVTGFGQRLFPQFERRDPIIADLAAWNELRSAVAHHGGSDVQFIAGTRWEDCAKIEVAIRAPVLCLTPFPEIYAYLTDPRPFLGKNAIIVAREGYDVADALGAYFSRIEPLDRLVVSHLGRPAMVLNLYRGLNLRASYPWPYGPYRSPPAPTPPPRK